MSSPATQARARTDTKASEDTAQPTTPDNGAATSVQATGVQATGVQATGGPNDGSAGEPVVTLASNPLEERRRIPGLPKLRRILRSSTYRLALLYMGVFGLSVCALLAFIYWSTAGYMARQTDATIESEITGLAERYRLGNLDGLVRSINERIRRNPFGSSIYLLTDANFDRVVGNLDRWPNVEPGEDGWLEFELSAGPGLNDRHRARGRRFRLSRGFYLLVGRDMSERIATEALIVKAMISGLAFTILLAIAGGIMLSRSTLRRIDAINSTSREIMDGDLSRRIPTRGTNDDFDRLAANLNGMLDQIEHLMDGVRQVSNNIAHDLRTPLTRLRNRLEALSLKTDDESVELALSEADGLLATFNALLRIARIEGGARRSGFGQVSLDQVLADVLELYEPLAHERDQQVRASITPDVSFAGDRDLLFQAFANLIDNAIKYTPNGGSIGVSLYNAPNATVVRITDSGPGIPEAERKRVFDRFVRLEESRTQPGNGLGLSLVAAVAKLHSATIRLSDANPGLDVFFEFPVNPAKSNQGTSRSRLKAAKDRSDDEAESNIHGETSNRR